MERSLTALLPVHNAQSILSRVVLELLDVLPELTRRFEICIIDNCSTDDTIEIADELTADYPQVRAIRHTARWSRLAAIHAGLAYSTGEIILLSDTDCALSADEIHRLWRAAESHAVVLGVPRAPKSRRAGWRTSVPTNQGGFVLFHRQASSLIREHLAGPDELRNFLAANHLQWQEVEVRDRGREPSRRMHLDRTVRADRVAWLSADRSAAACGRAPRPNYRETLRDFALGE